MALVAYDNSDSSEYEDEEDVNSPVVQLIAKPEKPTETVLVSSEADNTDTSNENGPALFNKLPQPSTKIRAVVEEDDEFLHKKETADNADVVKPKAKITVPSLSDFKDIKSTAAASKPKASNTKKSGLLSMLPQPRNGFSASSKSLIPNVLTHKPTMKKPPLPSLKKPKDSKTLITEYSDESDADDDVQNDFFSFNKPVDLPEPIDLPLEPTEKTTANTDEPKLSKLESYFKKDVVETPVEEPEDLTEYPSSEAGSSYNDNEGSSNNDEMVLDEEAILKLCGSRGKRRREDIQIVDVDQKEVLAEAQQWLLKGLMDDTSKRMSTSKKRGNEPTNMQKRKHQITYLAHQAKANEAELQNQWANNRMTRRKTQSKYGF